VHPGGGHQVPTTEVELALDEGGERVRSFALQTDLPRAGARIPQEERAATSDLLSLDRGKSGIERSPNRVEDRHLYRASKPENELEPQDAGLKGEENLTGLPSGEFTRDDRDVLRLRIFFEVGGCEGAHGEAPGREQAKKSEPQPNEGKKPPLRASRGHCCLHSL